MAERSGAGTKKNAVMCSHRIQRRQRGRAQRSTEEHATT